MTKQFYSKKYDGRNYRPRCKCCGVYLSYDSDQLTPYGCYNPESPEPYDSEYLCDKHSDELYHQFLKDFQDGSRSGDWCKSRAEIRAAKECKLSWVGSNGIGILGDKKGNWAEAHRYISSIEFKRLKIKESPRAGQGNTKV